MLSKRSDNIKPVRQWVRAFKQSYNRRFLMKKTVLMVIIAMAGSSSVSSASSSSREEGECAVEAKDFLSRKIKQPNSLISFYDGALLGDGVNAIRISLFRVQGTSGLYKVEVDAEDCALRNIELINN
jgi:hypothetical protein